MIEYWYKFGANLWFHLHIINLNWEKFSKSLLEKKAWEFFSVRTNNEVYNYSGVIEDRYWYFKSLKQDDTSPRAFAGGKRTTLFYEF